LEGTVHSSGKLEADGQIASIVRKQGEKRKREGEGGGGGRRERKIVTPHITQQLCPTDLYTSKLSYRGWWWWWW